MIKKVGFAGVITLFAISVVLLFPLTREGWDDGVSVKYNKYEHPVRTQDEVMREAKTRMNHLIDHYADLGIKTVHQNLIFVNQEMGGWDDETNNATSNLARFNMDSYTRLIGQGKLDRDELWSLQQADPAWKAIRNPEEVSIRWGYFLEHAAKMSPFSAAFFGLGVIGLIELWGFSKVLNVAWLTLSFLLSVSGGAVAQTVKSVGSKVKESSSKTLQMDARVSVYASDGPPTPGLFLRVTASSKRWLAESVSTGNPRQRNWSNDVVAGRWLLNIGKTRVLAAGYLTEASGRGPRIGAGVQIFRADRWGLLAIPVLRWERQIHGPPSHSFAVGTNPNIKFGKSRWSISPDILARKTQGKPWTWQAGVGIRFLLGKHQLEPGWLSNQAGTSQFRARLISSFSY